MRQGLKALSHSGGGADPAVSTQYGLAICARSLLQVFSSLINPISLGEAARYPDGK
jgi:hypothetical protein